MGLQIIARSAMNIGEVGGLSKESLSGAGERRGLNPFEWL